MHVHIHRHVQIDFKYATCIAYEFDSMTGQRAEPPDTVLPAGVVLGVVGRAHLAHWAVDGELAAT